MPIRLCLVLLGFLLGGAVLKAEARALIIVGLATDEGQATRLNAEAKTMKEGFVARGFADRTITVMQRAKRDAVLAALAPAVGAGPADETWVVLLGTAAPARDGQPAFQLSGPRLTAADLAVALAALPGKKFVVVATSASGGFLLPLLALPGVEAVAATADAGQVNEPRFAEQWAEALVARPQATFGELAREAAKAVEVFYAQNQIAQGEYARLIERASGTILEAPFAPETVAEIAPKADDPRAGPTALSIADIEIPKVKTAVDEHLPATPETRALIAEAKAAAEGSVHAGLHLRTEVEVVVQRDFSVRETWSTRSYVRTGEALDELGTVVLNAEPPRVLARLDAARVIRPDGSQIVINPRPLAERAAATAKADRDAPESGGFEDSPPYIELPEVTPGCVVEASWTVERRPSQDLPEFYNEWVFAERYPTRSLRVSLTLPREERWRGFAPNFSVAPVVSETDVARTQTWTLADVAAFEPLPGDPPARTFIPWLGVSSLASWDAFAAWYRRLAVGSDTVGPGVTALADDIAKNHPDRAGRLRAAYERVAALRYVAVELGVGGLRPRTPEQVWGRRYGDCKDKANLLVAVLRKLGIGAEFALVNRFNATFPEFPGWQFNHAVARVPAAPGEGQPTDLWLDTTDRLVPFGVIGPGDLGRQALVFSEHGATAAFHEITAAQEPPAEWREQLFFDRATARWHLRIKAAGSAEAMLRHLFAELGPQASRERVRVLLAWPAASVADVAHPDAYDLNQPFVVNITFAPGLPADTRAHSYPLALVPGLAAYVNRSRDPAASLVWDDGRDWLFARTEEDVEQTSRIPGRLPPAAPGQTRAPLSFAY